jgi:hypothetical protein
MADPKNCHHQISQEKVLSWFLPLVPTRLELGNGGPKKAVHLCFREPSGVNARN